MQLEKGAHYLGEGILIWQIVMKINVEKLRKDILDECAGAYFARGFGMALIESFDIERVTPEQLIEIARQKGLNIENYLY